jgi:hypothetical protein
MQQIAADAGSAGLDCSDSPAGPDPAPRHVSVLASAMHRRALGGRVGERHFSQARAGELERLVE